MDFWILGCYTNYTKRKPGVPRVPSRSNLPYLSIVFLGAAVLLLSCGSSLHPDQLTVHVPAHFSGNVDIRTCVAGAPAGEVTLDEKGSGNTSLCPSVDHLVEIDVITADGRFKLNSSEVRVLRTGDGFATAIQAQISK
jgi:hypothetical protein